MSYILEAIKKADNKRKLGEVPDVHSNHNLNMDEPVRRAAWPYLLAAILFFNATLITWWLEPWRQDQPVTIEAQIEETKPGKAVVTGNLIGKKTVEKSNIDAQDTSDEGTNVINENIISQEKSTLESEEVLANNVAPPTTPKFTPVGKALPTPAPMIDETVTPPSSPLPLPPPTVTENDLTAGTVAPPASGGKLESTPELIRNKMETKPLLQNRKLKDKVSQPVKVMDDNTTSTSKISSQDDGNILEDSDDEVDEDGEEEEVEESIKIFDISRVPYQYQLPMSIQEKLPELKISFHSYKFKPGSRLVRINGRIMRQGQDVTKEIKLEKIVPTGVVLLFDGRRFRVDL